MNILIIEDEPLVANHLKQLIGELKPAATIIATIGSLGEAVKWLKTNPEPDLLMLDIQLSDGVSFDLFNHVPVTCPVIFTTAYDAYALRAFKLNSIDYLLKPIDKNELDGALQKFDRLQQITGKELLQDQLNGFLANLQRTEKQPTYKSRFFVVSRNALIPISQERIAYFHRNELIYLITTDNEKFVADYDTMEELEELIDPSLFFRANRQFIIHIDAVSHIKNGINGKLNVHLKQNLSTEIDVSREKAHQLKDWLS